MKKRQQIKAQLRKVKNEGSNLTKLYLYGDITDGGWDNTISALAVRDQLEEIDSEEIEIHINSYGGDIFEAITIMNQLRDKSKDGHNITVVIDGIAASGGSIICMGADKVVMPKSSQMMIHNPWTIAFGNAKELRKVADNLEKMQESLEQTYLNRFSGTREELIKLLDDETYLTADEALACGLADEVIDDKEIEEIEEDDEVIIDEEVIDRIAERVAAKINVRKPVETPQENEEPKQKNKIMNLFSRGAE